MAISPISDPKTTNKSIIPSESRPKSNSLQDRVTRAVSNFVLGLLSALSSVFSSSKLPTWKTLHTSYEADNAHTQRIMTQWKQSKSPSEQLTYTSFPRSRSTRALTDLKRS